VTKKVGGGVKRKNQAQKSTKKLVTYLRGSEAKKVKDRRSSSARKQSGEIHDGQAREERGAANACEQHHSMEPNNWHLAESTTRKKGTRRFFPEEEGRKGIACSRCSIGKDEDRPESESG